MAAQSTVRKKMIAKIHIAKKQLAMEDGSYRAFLKRITGQESCSQLKEPELENVLQEFKKIGFKKKPAKRAGARKLAVSEQASKIRALWLNLYHIGEVKDPSEDALAAFVKRSSGVEDLHWITTAQADKTIRALRGWLERKEFRFPNADIIEFMGSARSFHKLPSINTEGLAHKCALISLQSKILQISIFPWLTANGFGNYDYLFKLDPDVADQIIEKLGKEIRRMRK